MQARYHEVGSFLQDFTGVGMSTLGFVVLVKDSPASQVNYTHLRHIRGMNVEFPKIMRQLPLIIEDNVSFHKASVRRGLQHVR